MKKASRPLPAERPVEIKRVLRDNFNRLSGGLSPEALTKSARPPVYVSGAKIGEALASRTIRLAIDPRSQVMPGLDIVDALAKHFGVLPAEMLVDWANDRETLLKRILEAPPKVAPRT